MSQRYRRTLRCTGLRIANRTWSGIECHNFNNKIILSIVILSWEGVIAAIKRPQVLTKSLRAVKLIQYIPRLSPAFLVRGGLIEPSHIRRDLFHQHVPRRINSLQLRKLRREEAFI